MITVTSAENFARTALAIRHNEPIVSELQIAKQMNNLALICQHVNRDDEAEKLLLQAVAIYAKHGTWNARRNYMNAQYNLSSFYVMKSRYEEALQLVKEVHDIVWLNFARSRGRNFRPMYALVEEIANANKAPTNDELLSLFTHYGRIVSDDDMINNLLRLQRVYHHIPSKRIAGDVIKRCLDWCSSN